MIKKINKLEDVHNFVWKMSRDDRTASYGRIESEKQAEFEIDRAIKKENYNIIGYYVQENLKAVCTYYWEDEIKYAQTKIFLIEENHDKIGKELVEYISRDLRGYELYIGIPKENILVEKFLENNDFHCVDDTADTRLYNLSGDKGYSSIEIEKLEEKDFEEYAEFHDAFAVPLEMYYQSENLRRDLDKFEIFIYRLEKEIKGSIFVKVVRDTAEVFGLWIQKECEEKGVERLLINHMIKEMYLKYGELKEIAYFIDANCQEELEAAKSAGFIIKGNYICYKKDIK